MTHLTDAALAERCLRHLEAVVAIDSQSDESSPTIPSTEGQRRLADWLAGFYTALGASVERDENANVLAAFPGRGIRAGASPLAFLVHLDTARGTLAVPRLRLRRAWSGEPLDYPANPQLRVDLDTYPAAAEFAGQDLVHGPGDAPFGLDDKLGLALCMTTASILGEDIAHPPLIFVARPDEEVGRHEAVVALAEGFVQRGVREAYTVDGILPFEINVENFNAAMARVVFPGDSIVAAGRRLEARIGGVNTHGATAAAEGHRGAPRLVAEWMAADPAARLVAFQSDALRDCDAVVAVRSPDPARTEAVLAALMAPHLPRGASYAIAPAEGPDDAAAGAMIAWVQRFYASAPGFTLPAEDSSGRDGYTQPFRAAAVPGGLRLDLRIRDFDPAGLAARIAHVRSLAPDAEIVEQYVNMGPRLAAFPGLVERATRAAARVGVEPRLAPIRGGTGVDPFLDRGIPVANLGTGYFSPESEKEFTSLQMMARHIRWLYALIQS